MSQLLYPIATNLQRPYPCFRREAKRLHYCGHCLSLPDVRISEKLKMAAVTGNKYDIMYILASMHDGNKTPTGRATRLWACGFVTREESKMAHINFRLTYAISKL
jgi:hypothetical protein